MIFSRKIAKPNHEEILEYRVITLPRNKEVIHSVFEALSGYSMVYFQPDYAYVIMRRGENMNDKKYKVLEAPNSVGKLELLINSEYEAGWSVCHVNDYSVVFIREEK